MKSYSELNVFSGEEIVFFEKARLMVDALPASFSSERPLLRCHELARAVGQILGLQVQDGQYGFVDHTWLWTTPLQKDRSEFGFRVGFPNILDVYSVGQLPMARLVDCSLTQRPHVGWAYRPTDVRGDINWELVERVVELLRKNPGVQEESYLVQEGFNGVTWLSSGGRVSFERAYNSAVRKHTDCPSMWHRVVNLDLEIGGVNPVGFLASPDKVTSKKESL